MSEAQPHNPFAPPVTDEPPEPPWAQDVPSSVVPHVFGVLSIVFSSLMLLLMLLGVLGTGISALRRAEAAETVAAEQSMSPPVAGSAARAERAPRKPEPVAYTVLAVAVALLFLLLTPSLLVIGIGQVRYRRWALKPTIVWSVLALVCLACLTALGVVDPEPGSRPLIAVISLVVFLAPYPILLLVFFTRPRVAAAMQTR